MKHPMPNLISTSWRDFLKSAPYFHASLFGQIDYDEASSLNDMPRAAYFFGMFDGEVSNGGVMQYFYNLAFLVKDFEKAAEFVACHPTLEEIVPFMKTVHAAWAEKRERVYDARYNPESQDEWPEDLFSDRSFDALENEYYAINERIMMQLDHHILQNPELYFSFEAIPGITGKGVEAIAYRGAEFRFVDGFPEGPNLIKQKQGEGMVWISRNRSRLDYKSSDFFGEKDIHGWIDYPSQRAHTVYYDKGIDKIANTIGNVHPHGSSESFTDGEPRFMSFAHNGERLYLGLKDKETGEWVFQKED